MGAAAERDGMKNQAAARKLLNQRQSELRQVMLDFDQHETAMRLFLQQHARLHAARVSGGGSWSYEDQILDDMNQDQIRQIPQGGDHSVAWCIWHLARIEDVTMNMLVAGRPQLLRKENWLERMRVDVRHSGNAMDAGETAAHSMAIDIEALRDYRRAVGRCTREIVQQLQPGDLKKRVDAGRLARVIEEQAVQEAARGVVDYWSRRSIAGLLLMPATRHNLVHLNEAMRIKERCR